jgi:hypothetical protein
LHGQDYRARFPIAGIASLGKEKNNYFLNSLNFIELDDFFGQTGLAQQSGLYGLMAAMGTIRSEIGGSCHFGGVMIYLSSLIPTSELGVPDSVYCSPGMIISDKPNRL